MPPREPGLPTTLDIVEEFFGEEVSPDLLRAVRSLPPDQAGELRRRIDERYAAVDASLQRRADAERRVGVVARVEAEFVDRTGDTSAAVEPAILDPRHAHLLTGELHVHESTLLDAGHRVDLPDIGVLKHLTLYCERVLVRDPLVTRTDRLVPVNEPRDPTPAWNARIADGLRQVLPLAGLIRAGHVVLGRSDAEFRGTFTGSWGRPDKDRLIEQAIVELLDREAAELDVDPRLPAPDAPAGMSTEVLAGLEAMRGQAFLTQCETLALSPVTSSQSIIRFLDRRAQAYFDPRSARDTPSLLSPAVRYAVPPLSEVSFADIIALRRDEEVFAEVRSALAALASACRGGADEGDYAAYKSAVRRHAEDVLRPSHERLQRWQRQASLRRLAGFGVGSAVSLTISAAARLGLVPGLGYVAGPAGGAVQRWSQRRARQRYDNATVALDVLTSILNY